MNLSLCDYCVNNLGTRCAYAQDEYNTDKSFSCDWYDDPTTILERKENRVSSKFLCERCKFSVNDKCEKLRMAYMTKKSKKCQDFVIRLPLSSKDGQKPSLFLPKEVKKEEPKKTSPESPKKIEQKDICLLMYSL